MTRSETNSSIHAKRVSKHNKHSPVVYVAVEDLNGKGGQNRGPDPHPLSMFVRSGGNKYRAAEKVGECDDSPPKFRVVPLSPI